MKISFFVLAGVTILILVSFLSSQPSYNGSAPGCSGSSCHTFNDNDVSVVPLGNFEVQVTLAGVQSGENVAGELVDVNGTVVDVVNPTASNPFILTAPNSGSYLVNAGYKKPSRHWDSVSVDIEVTSIVPSEGLIRSFELFQNYPNPFNPITHIGYRLPKTSDVKLEVIDLSGRRIITLLDTRKSAGYHTIDFDGSRLASGVYLYRIRAGNIMQVKKMALMK